MKLKTQLLLGLGLLFVLIIVLSAIGITYSNLWKRDTENILVANYNSLVHAKNILVALEQEQGNDLVALEKSLKQQEHNITEAGERQVTQELREHFEHYKTNRNDSLAVAGIRSAAFDILQMNMEAIQRKSEIAKSTADRAVFRIAVASTFCFLIAFSLLLGLPGQITDPLRELTESIRQIADKNYSQRVHFDGHSEFGQLARSFNTMAQKLESYNDSNLARIMVEKKRMETLVDNMHDPVIGLDESGKVIFANEAALKITGMKPEDMVGREALQIALENDLMRTLLRDIDAAPADKPTPLQIFSDQKESYFEKEVLRMETIPTGEQQKQPIGHLIFLRNVTEYKELDAAKTHFIATVSHEFKTPISSIKMGLQLLENEQIGPLNDEQKGLLQGIRDDAGRLLRITGELLNMSQVESGNIQLSITPSSVPDMIRFAADAARVQAEQKNIRLDVQIPQALPPVLADNDKVVWVLTNLISNAIQYSYEHATVFISAVSEAGQVRIRVRDTGQGIAPQYKDKIFDRYFRVPGASREGTGLGLSISKEFMEAQGGFITVESELGAGSTFCLGLNVAG